MLNKLNKLAQGGLALGLASFNLALCCYPAAAEVHGNHFMVRSALDRSYCIDASLDKAQEGRGVYIYKCHGRDNQRWTFTDGANGDSAIVGLEGRCLDIRGRSVKDNTPAQLWRCHYGANQQFQVTPKGQIRELQSGKCLTIDNRPGNRKPVFIDECDGNKAQLWVLSK